MPELRGRLTIERRQAIRAVREVRTELQSLAKEPQLLHVSLDKAAKTGNKALTGLKRDARELAREWKQTFGSVEKEAQGAEKATTRLARETARTQREATRAIDEQKDAIQRAKEAQRARVVEAKRLAGEEKQAREAALREFVRESRAATRQKERDEKAAIAATLRAQKDADKAAVRSARDTAKERARLVREGRAAAGQLGDRASMAATGAGLGIFAGLGAATKAAIEWESAFTGVEKTVNATSKELAALEIGLRNMATEIPVSAVEIAKIAENAGQLGIQTGAIKDFTRVMADLSVATNLTAEQASSDLAKIANITKLPQTEFDRLGATIVDLGAKGASTEADIVSMAMRIASAGKQVGMSEANVLAFASTLSSAGVEAEAGGTAISTAFKRIDAAVREGGTQLDNFSKVAGVSSAEFKRQFQDDAAGAVAKFVEGLGKMQKAGGNVFGTLKDLQLNDSRVTDSVLRMAGNYEMLAGNIGVADEAWKKNTALTEEARKQYATSAAQAEILANNFKEAGILVGTVLVPAFNDGVRAVKPYIEAFRALNQEKQTNIVKYTAIAGGVLLIGGQLKGLIETVVLVRKSYIGLRTAMFTTRIAGVATATSITTANATMAASGAKSFTALRVAGVTGLGAIGIAAAALVIAVYGIAAAIDGVDKASSQSSENIRNHWSGLGGVWDEGAKKLNTLANWLNRIGKNPVVAKIDQISRYNPAGYVGGLARDFLKNNFGTEGIPARAEGGPVNAGTTYLVGEKGPELFVAKQSGTIVPNHILNRQQSLSSQIGNTQGWIDERRLSRSRARNRQSDPELIEAVQRLRDLKRELSAAKREAGEFERAFKTAQRSAAKEAKLSAEALEAAARARQESANKSLETLKALAETSRGVFGEAQREMIALGRIDDPLGGALRAFDRFLGLSKRAQNEARAARTEIERLMNAANRKSGAAEGSTSTAGASGVSSGDASAVASGEVSGRLVNQIARGLTTSRGMSACANVAGKILEGVGRALPKTNVARDLYKNALNAGWQKVKPGEMQAGDLVTWRGGRYGKLKYNEGGKRVGYHTEVADSRTTTSGSPGSGIKTSQKLHDLKNVVVLRAPGAGQSYTVTSGTSSGTSSGTLSTTARSLLGNLGLLDDVLFRRERMNVATGGKVGKGWGVAVKDNESAKYRFAVQSGLASGELLPLLSQVRGALGDKAARARFEKEAGVKARWETGWTRDDQALDLLRQLANKLDYGVGGERERQAAAAAVKEAREEAQKEAKRARDEATAAMLALRGQNSDTARLRASSLSYARTFGTGTGHDDFNARNEEQMRLWRDESSPVVQLFKSGQIKEANAAFRELLQAFDDARTHEKTLESLARENEELARSVIAAREALREQPSFTDTAREALKHLRGALDDTNLSSADLARTLSELDPAVVALGEAPKSAVTQWHELRSAIDQAKGRVSFLKDVESLGSADGGRFDDLTNEGNDAGRALLEFRRRNFSEVERIEVRRTEAVAAYRAEVAATPMLTPAGIKEQTRQMDAYVQSWEALVGIVRQADIEKRSDALSTYARDVRDRVALAGTFDPVDRELLNIAQNARRESTPEADIKTMQAIARTGLEAERNLARVFSMVDGFEGAWMDTFDAVLSGEKKWSAALTGGIHSTLADISREVIQSGVRSLLGNLFGGLLGGIGGTPGIGPSTPGFAGLIGPRRIDGSFATGLDRVPHHGLIAELHKDESILTASEAQVWRDLKAQERRNRVPIGATSSGGSGTTVVTYNHYGDIRANNPADYQRQLQQQARSGRSGAKTRTSRFESERTAGLVAARGGSRI